jgi:hypothetical protein
VIDPTDRPPSGGSGRHSGPDHPDRAADLGERADGAHAEFIDAPPPGGADTPPGRSDDQPEGSNDAPRGRSGDAPHRGTGERAPAGAGAADRDRADRPVAGGEQGSGPPVRRQTTERQGAAEPPGSGRARPVVIIVAAVLVITGLIYLAMILGVFTTG